MARIFLVAALGTISFNVFSQAAKEFVWYEGRVLSSKDSMSVKASVLYEKHPYYDDMGTKQTNEDGEFKLYLQLGENYSVTIKSQNFVSNHVEVTIHPDSINQITIFYLKPDPNEAIPELITLKNLIFDQGSDHISSSSYEGLNDLVKWLTDRPSLVIQLEGHTDFAGNEEANMRLSQSRVDAVKDYLVQEGIKKLRVLTKAFGGTQPLYTERTEEAKSKNRRVEVRVISK